MKMNLRRVGPLIVAGFACTCLTGCLSPDLLEERTEHAPAPNPNVELRLKTTSPSDVLVLYDDHIPKSGKVVRRGFYLFANQKQLSDGKRPAFVNLKRLENHKPIAILAERPANTNAMGDDLYAISTSPTRFDLRSRDRTLADFELPEFGDWLTTKKFFLFPLTAAVDAVGIGAAAGAVGAIGVAEEAAETGRSYKFP